MQLSNKTVLVTGANRGIGKALVTALLDRDVKKIYAAARDTAKLPAFNDDRVVALQLDIANIEEVQNAAKVADDIDLLINNAGVAAFTSLLTGPRELIERDMTTNYYGTLDMVREFAPLLENKEDAGIVNLVTIAAFANFPIVGGYSASKAALFSLSQGIRVELAAKGISVHTVNPGPIDTELAKEFPMEKASAADTAENILDGLANNEADIFPDAAGRQMFDVWNNNYRDLENMVLEMHQAA
jgi:NAD(P)-dependent dehydrogenase (short-subunit alcohol dehydrogenase family)